MTLKQSIVFCKTTKKEKKKGRTLTNPRVDFMLPLFQHTCQFKVFMEYKSAKNSQDKAGHRPKPFARTI